MNSIYEGALATIVAAQGDVAECGLPSVGFVPRVPQPAALANGKHLVSTLPHISVVLRDTKWATRGRTYQEAMLSRRCLVFTDRQVYFICQKLTCCEAVNKHDGLKAPGDELPGVLFNPRVIVRPPKEYSKSFQIMRRNIHYESLLKRQMHSMLSKVSWQDLRFIAIGHSQSRSGEAGVTRGRIAKRLVWDLLARKGYLCIRRKLPSWLWVGLDRTHLLSLPTLYEPRSLKTLQVKRNSITKQYNYYTKG